MTLAPVAFLEGEIPNKQCMKDIISTFLAKEWLFVDPTSLTMTFNSSFTNAHCVVERPKPASERTTEPLKLFIKLHNDSASDIEIFKQLMPSKQEEASLCYEYGRAGLGARVYGFFKTLDGTLGRVDEFLDARTLEPEDVEVETIREDIAKGLATFHAMQMSLERQPVELYYEAITKGLAKYHRMENLKELGMKAGVSIDGLVDYDFASRLKKVVAKLDSMGAKTGWCIHDVQYMNVLVKNQPTEEQSKTVLIDFECVMQNYRAFDIGGHFMQKMFKWFDEESKIADCRKYTEEEKRHFCEAYAERWNELTGDADTGEQVYLEAEYGYMLAITFDVHNMLCFMNDEEDKDPLNLLGLGRLFEEFKGQYDRLELEDI